MGFRAFKGISFAKDVSIAMNRVAAAVKGLILIGTGLTIDNGNLVLTLGDLTMTSGNLLLTSGDVTMTTGTLLGNRANVVVDAGDAVSPTIAQSGSIWISTKATESYTITLPVATTLGIVYTFYCGNAGGQIIINANGAEVMFGLDDPSVTPASITNGIFTNTGATNILGDYITLCSDGVSAWYAVGQKGIWAAT